MSALGCAGSPCSTAMPQPSGRNEGHGPHFSEASSNVFAGAAATGASWAIAIPQQKSTSSGVAARDNFVMGHLLNGSAAVPDADTPAPSDALVRTASLPEVGHHQTVRGIQSVA